MPTTPKTWSWFLGQSCRNHFETPPKGNFSPARRTGDLGIHSDSPPDVLDGQWAGDQSPSGSVV